MTEVKCFMSEQMDFLEQPLAYHITFGTYGTRLHGDARGTVDRRMNEPGEPIIGSEPDWWRQEHGRLNFEPVVLDAEGSGLGGAELHP
jgi:hypothetical protein